MNPRTRSTKLTNTLSNLINLLLIVSILGTTLLPPASLAASIPDLSPSSNPQNKPKMPTNREVTPPSASLSSVISHQEGLQLVSTPAITNIYMPIIMKDGVGNPSPPLPTPVEAEIVISATIGGKLKVPNGAVIEVSPGAFPEDGVLRYKSVALTSSPFGLQPTSRGFELQAFTLNGQEIHRFAGPIVGRIPYDYTDIRGAYERLSVHYLDGNSQSWQPVPSQVDYHNLRVVFTTTHFTQFGVMAEPLTSADQIECDLAAVGRGGSSIVRDVMCEAFIRAGGIDVMGIAQSGDNGSVHSWGNTQVQDFTGGTGNNKLSSPILMYRNDTGVAYYMDREIVKVYADSQTGGPGGFLGLPIANQRQPGPAWYKDDNNDFRDGPIMYFDHGFIAKDTQDKNVEAHRYFPVIKNVALETAWVKDYFDIFNGVQYYKFKISGVVNEAIVNPFNPNDSSTLHAGFWARLEGPNYDPYSSPDGQFLEDNGRTQLAVGEIGERTFSTVFTETQLKSQAYQIYFFVYRDEPDDLSGYFPCNYGYAAPPPLHEGWIRRRMLSSHIVYSVDCKSGGGGNEYDAPPQVSIIDTWLDGNGKLAVKAEATDDRGIQKVILKSDIGIVQFESMTHKEGTDFYEGIIENIPPGLYSFWTQTHSIHFTVTAYDTNGQTATVDQDNYGTTHSSAFGICPRECYAGNPVNTAIGNDPDSHQDLVVPGRGGTHIVINRNTNSQSERDGPFGRGSSFEYDMALELVDNILLKGIQVRYGDGHTANFSDAGNGRYNPISSANFDYLSKNGSNYVLHIKEDETTYWFDSNGRLNEIRNRNGASTILNYDSNGVLKAITNASGRTVELDWVNSRIVEIRGPENKTLRYEYDRNLLRFFTDARGNKTEYQYDANGHIVAVITPAGYPHLQQELDERGRVTWQIIGQGERRDFVYDDTTRTTIVTDAYDNRITYTYDKNYNIASVTDARGHTSYSVYDDRGRLLQSTDRRGQTWTYEYDDWGNRTKQIDPIDGYSAAYYNKDITTWEYNDQHQPIKVTNALGHITRYEYDAVGNLTHIYLPDGSVLITTYTGDGQVQTSTDEAGNVTTNTYDADGNLSTITDGEGHTSGFGYDNLGRQTSITDANGHPVYITYDGNDNITNVTDAKGRITRFEYDKNNNLTDIYDRRNGHTHKEYDSSDRLIAETDPEGARTEHIYDLMGHLTITKNPRGFTTQHDYDENYNIKATQDEAGYWRHYEYDPNNNKIVEIDPQGNATRYIYDALDRVKFKTDALDYTNEYCYNALDQLITHFDPRRAETRFQYDSRGRLVRLINPLGETYDWSYDGVGNLLAETNGEGETTHYKYDHANRRIEVSNPLNNTATIIYDPVGNVIQTIDARNNSTFYGYDENNNLTVITDALNAITNLDYNEEDERISVDEPDGGLTQFDYYSDGQLRELTEPGGAATSYRYDPNKNVIELTNARGKVTGYHYEARDLLERITDPLDQVTSHAYDELGRQISTTDAENKTTDYHYDALGRLTGVTDALDQTTQYAHDPVGNTTAITYTNGVTNTFEYNFLNQLDLEVDALNRTYRYDYDRAGRLIRKVDGEWQVIHFGYDEAGRLTHTIFGETGRQIDFEYDANGNQTAMRDWNGTLTRNFDPLNRPTTVTDYANRSLTYSWNPDGTRASFTYPDGRILNYTYNSDNRLEQVTLPGGQNAAYTYDPLGYLTQLRYSNGTEADYGYDDADRLTSLHNSAPGNTAIAWYDYVLNKVGNRTDVTELRVFAPGDPVTNLSRHYTYDDLHRLVRATTSISQAYQLNWELDSVGNWQSRSGLPEPSGSDLTTSQPISQTYEHNPINALVQAGDWVYQYDDNGSRIGALAPLTATQYATLTNTFGPEARLLISYKYDFEHHLTGMEEGISYVVSSTFALSPTMTAVYTYDGLGRRVEKQVSVYISGATLLTEPTVLKRQYLYDGLDAVIEYEALNDLPDNTTYYYRANGRLIALEREPSAGPTERHWYHFDGLGSVVALTDDSGSLTTAYRYNEYGELLAGDIAENRYTYTGQERDEETAFYHFYARNYDPTQGVWLTQDIYRGMLSEPLSLHRFGYVQGNPINYSDYLGFKQMVFVQGISGPDPNKNNKDLSTGWQNQQEYKKLKSKDGGYSDHEIHIFCYGEKCDGHPTTDSVKDAATKLWYEIQSWNDKQVTVVSHSKGSNVVEYMLSVYGNGGNVDNCQGGSKIIRWVSYEGATGGVESLVGGIKKQEVSIASFIGLGWAGLWLANKLPEDYATYNLENVSIDLQKIQDLTIYDIRTAGDPVAAGILIPPWIEGSVHIPRQEKSHINLFKNHDIDNAKGSDWMENYWQDIPLI